MEGFTYKYLGTEYPVYGMNLEHARKNAVLEAFIRYHENNPKIGMTVAQGTDYSFQDKFRKRADTLISYIRGDIEFFDPESQPVLEVIKEAYSTTKPIGYVIPERKPFFKTGEDREYHLQKYKRAPEFKSKVKRCGGFLAGEDCYVAIAAYSRIPYVILGYPKSRYESLRDRYCKISDLPEVNETRSLIKFGNHKEVNINGIRHVWAKRTNRSSGYQAQPYCKAINAAIDNYDYYLSKYANL